MTIDRPQPTEAEQPSSVKEDILRGVEFKTGFDTTRLSYSDEIGAFELPHEDGPPQILMFRVHSDQSVATATHGPRTKQQEAKKSWYGTGTYLGNTPESVGVYGWRPGSTTSVFLTPPLGREEITDQREQPGSNVVSVHRLGRHLLKVVKLQKNAIKVVDDINTGYGDSKLAVIDMGADIYASQKALSIKHRHAVKPCWFVWRGNRDELTEVGVVKGRELPIRNNLLRAVNQAAQRRVAAKADKIT